MLQIKKIKEYYDDIPVAAKASLWYTVCSVIQKGFALLSTPIFTRLMPTEEYGVYITYQSWYSIIIIFATLNMYYSAYNNVLTKWSEERDVSTAAMQGLSSAITFFVFVVFFISYGWWSSILKLPFILIIFLMVQILFEPALNFWMVRQRYEYRYKNVVIVTLIISIISTIVSICFVIIAEKKGIARVIAFSLTQSFFGAIFYIYHFFKGKTFFSKKYWSFVLKFCVPLIPHYLSFTILNQADRIMISNIIGQGEAAIYSVAYSISSMMQIITQAVLNSLTPYTYQSLKNNRIDEIKKTVDITLVLIFLMCVVVMMFAPEVLIIFAPKEYHSAVNVMPMVVASTWFLFIYPLFSNIELYYEKTGFVTIASSIAALLNIALNAIFIQKYGIYAAALSTLVCFVFMTLGHYYFYIKIVKKGTELYNIKKIFLYSFTIILMTILCNYLYQYTIIRFSIALFVLGLLFYFRKAIISNIRNIIH